MQSGVGPAGVAACPAAADKNISVMVLNHSHAAACRNEIVGTHGSTRAICAPGTGTDFQDDHTSLNGLGKG